MLEPVEEFEATPTRPIIRYHGGKWLLAPWIVSNLPAHRVYVEPYGGAASVLLNKPRSYGEVYNDLDGEIVALFRVARDCGDELREKLALTPFSREEYRLSFKFAEDPLEQARRTVVRSFMGFGSNALCRDIQSGFLSNSKRSGTTPAHDWANYPDALGGIIARLRGVVIEHRDALGLMRQHDGPDTLHYCDPPYVHASRSSKVHGHHGYTHEMSDQEHRALAEELNALTGMVVLSGYACPLYDELFGAWYRIERPALADGARERTEILWFNERAMKRPHQGVLNL